MDDCVFCNIINKRIHSDLLKETSDLIVIRDIMPKAPEQFLVIPKKHIGSVNELEEKDKNLIGDIVLMAKTVAKENNIAESGYKVTFNVGRDGGQVIPHLHLHVMGGRQLGD